MYINLYLSSPTLEPYRLRQVGVTMSPEEADRLGLKPFGDGGAENETSPCRAPAEFFFVFFYDFL